MTTLLQNFDFWYWWVLGGGLLILELATGTTFFLWLALSAGVVGLIGWLIPSLSLELQAMVFAASILISAVLTKLYSATRVKEESINLNERGTQYIGKDYMLTEPILNGKSKLKIDDTFWTIKGPDAPVGTVVKVVRMDGLDLIVEIDFKEM